MPEQYPHTDVAITCRGRDAAGQEVLATGVSATVHLVNRDGRLAVSPRGCPHNTGSHSHQCMVARTSAGRSGTCPFAFSWPHIVAMKAGWTAPQEIADAFKELVTSLPEPSYHVVFVYTQGPLKGGRYTTSFRSKADFDLAYDTEMRSSRDVVAEGITKTEVDRLIDPSQWSMAR